MLQLHTSIRTVAKLRPREGGVRLRMRTTDLPVTTAQIETFSSPSSVRTAIRHYREVVNVYTSDHTHGNIAAIIHPSS